MEISRADLENENLHLREENERLKAELQGFLEFDRLNWRLFSTLSTRLQIHSASIKAAVSSLLDRNIFWGISAQQEFLEAISQSVDDISKLMINGVLANLLQMGSLDVTRKPYELHELMTAVQERTFHLSGERLLYGDQEDSGSLVFVDYKYFVHALSTLFSVIGVGDRVNARSRQGRFVLDKAPGLFVLSISEIAPPVITVVSAILSKQWTSHSMENGLPADKVFDLLLVIRLFAIQGIHLKLDEAHPSVLRVEIPIYE